MTEVCPEPRRGGWFSGTLEEAWAVPLGPRTCFPAYRTPRWPCPRSFPGAPRSLCSVPHLRSHWEVFLIERLLPLDFEQLLLREGKGENWH